MVKAPMMVPDLKTMASVILFPRIRKLSIKLDLKAPPQYCDAAVGLPDLSYSSPTKVGRKQFLAAGAFAVGALLGGLWEEV